MLVYVRFCYNKECLFIRLFNLFPLGMGEVAPTPSVDWQMAQKEVMEKDISNDPIQAAITRLEKQYLEDKQTALDRQRQEYEKQFLQVRSYHDFPSHSLACIWKFQPQQSLILSFILA